MLSQFISSGNFCHRHIDEFSCGHYREYPTTHICLNIADCYGVQVFHNLAFPFGLCQFCRSKSPGNRPSPVSIREPNLQRYRDEQDASDRDFCPQHACLRLVRSHSCGHVVGFGIHHICPDHSACRAIEDQQGGASDWYCPKCMDMRNSIRERDVGVGAGGSQRVDEKISLLGGG